MNKKQLILIIGAIVVIGVLIFVFSGAGNGKNGESAAPEQSPAEKVFELRLKDYNGNEIPFSDLKGTPLVINGWASWCPFCRKELPDFATAQKEFGEDIIIVAVNRAEPLGTAKRYSDDLAVTSDMIFLLDPNDSFYRAIQGFAMPETIFVNANGDVVDHKRGPMEIGEIRTRINDLLQS